VITALAPVSCEVIVVNDVALAVLRERHGVLEADEIKTGRLRPVDLARLRLQAQAQLECLDLGQTMSTSRVCRRRFTPTSISTVATTSTPTSHPAICRRVATRWRPTGSATDGVGYFH
jgi:hypothetical protein